MAIRVLITGGLGYIGGRIAVYLAGLGYQIVLGSRKAIPPPDWLPQAEVMQMSWDNQNILESCCNGIDIIIHAAGINAQNCAADPVFALTFNGVSTARLAIAADLAGVKRFIYLSTAHIYARPLVGTITEASCPQNLHPYATSHLAGEQTVLYIGQKSKNITPLILRLSNAVGPPVHKDINCWMLLTNDLCRQAVECKKLTLYSNGNQQRDFIAISEVCQVIRWLIGIDRASLMTNIFNVGSGVSISLLDMASKIQQCCDDTIGYRPEIIMQVKQETASSLVYKTERLKKHDIKINQDLKKELNTLLFFCKKNLG